MVFCAGGAALLEYHDTRICALSHALRLRSSGGTAPGSTTDDETEEADGGTMNDPAPGEEQKHPKTTGAAEEAEPPQPASGEEQKHPPKTTAAAEEAEQPQPASGEEQKEEEEEECCVCMETLGSDLESIPQTAAICSKSPLHGPKMCCTCLANLAIRAPGALPEPKCPLCRGTIERNRDADTRLMLPNGAVPDIEIHMQKVANLCGSVCVGASKDGVPHGKCEEKFSDGSSYSGWFANGEYDTSNAPEGYQNATYKGNGEVYVGSYKDGVRHGEGKLVYSDGSCYDGWFSDGKRDTSEAQEGNQRATYKKQDGYVYRGGFKNGLRHGEGEENRISGGSYSGWFAQDKYDTSEAPEGNQRATYTFPNGDFYVGSYRTGLRHGEGKTVYIDGSCYDGWYNMGKRDTSDAPEGHQTATFTAANGTVSESAYKDGEPKDGERFWFRYGFGLGVIGWLCIIYKG